jgi:hypothetical protein
MSIQFDGYATLALGYRYVVRLYPTDSPLSKLGELAVKLVLQAEREYDPGFSADRSFEKRSMTTCPTSGQELDFNLSIFVPARPGDNIASSLDAISQLLSPSYS